MTKRRGVRSLTLAIVIVVAILGAALVVQSRSVADDAPSYGSFALPAESDLAPLSDLDSVPLPASGGSSPSAASVSPSAGHDTSAHVVPPAGSEDSSATRDAAFNELWYDESHSAFAPLVVTDSWSWPQTSASASGYGSSNAPTSGRRSSSSAGYAGAGGGFSSGGGGLGNPQNSGSSAGAGLRSLLSDDPNASIAGAPAFLPTGGGNASGGPPAFPFLQFPGARFGGAIASGAALPNLGGGATADVTQLQQPVSVPEPSTALLLAGGLALAAYRSRRRLPRHS